MTSAETSDDRMRIYRSHRGTFDSWHPYRIVVDDTATLRIADGELLDLPGSTHSLRVSTGRYMGEAKSLKVREDQVVTVELTANPKVEHPGVRITVITEEGLQQKLLRFDRPPYVGGRVAGLARALLSTAIALGFSLVTLAACVAAMVHFAGSSGGWVAVIFLATVGTLVWLFFGVAGLTGVRSLYYYFRLPPPWRH